MSTSGRCPPSASKSSPQPVVVAVRPSYLLSTEGRQTGLMVLVKATGEARVIIAKSLSVGTPLL